MIRGLNPDAVILFRGGNGGEVRLTTLLHLQPRLRMSGAINLDPYFMASDRTYQRASAMTDLCEIWYWGILWKSVEKLQIWLKPNTFHEDLNMLYCCWRHKFVIKAFLCNNQYCYIVNSDMYLNDKQRTHCCVSTATIVTRTRRDVTRYALLVMRVMAALSLGKSGRYRRRGSASRPDRLMARERTPGTRCIYVDRLHHSAWQYRHTTVYMSRFWAFKIGRGHACGFLHSLEWNVLQKCQKEGGASTFHGRSVEDKTVVHMYRSKCLGPGITPFSCIWKARCLYVTPHFDPEDGSSTLLETMATQPTLIPQFLQKVLHSSRRDDHNLKIRTRKQRTDVGKYSFVNRTIRN